MAFLPLLMLAGAGYSGYKRGQNQQAQLADERRRQAAIDAQNAALNEARLAEYQRAIDAENAASGFWQSVYRQAPAPQGNIYDTAPPQIPGAGAPPQMFGGRELPPMPSFQAGGMAPGRGTMLPAAPPAQGMPSRTSLGIPQVQGVAQGTGIPPAPATQGSRKLPEPEEMLSLIMAAPIPPAAKNAAWAQYVQMRGMLPEAPKAPTAKEPARMATPAEVKAMRALAQAAGYDPADIPDAVDVETLEYLYKLYSGASQAAARTAPDAPVPAKPSTTPDAYLTPPAGEDGAPALYLGDDPGPGAPATVSAPPPMTATPPPRSGDPFAVPTPMRLGAPVAPSSPAASVPPPPAQGGEEADPFAPFPADSALAFWQARTREARRMPSSVGAAYITQSKPVGDAIAEKQETPLYSPLTGFDYYIGPGGKQVTLPKSASDNAQKYLYDNLEIVPVWSWNPSKALGITERHTAGGRTWYTGVVPKLKTVKSLGNGIMQYDTADPKADTRPQPFWNPLTKTWQVKTPSEQAAITKAFENKNKGETHAQALAAAAAQEARAAQEFAAKRKAAGTPDVQKMVDEMGAIAAEWWGEPKSSGAGALLPTQATQARDWNKNAPASARARFKELDAKVRAYYIGKLLAEEKAGGNRAPMNTVVRRMKDELGYTVTLDDVRKHK